jgi:hypothetical protein
MNRLHVPAGVLHPGMRSSVKNVGDIRYYSYQGQWDEAVPMAEDIIGMLTQVLSACNLNLDRCSQNQAENK